MEKLNVSDFENLWIVTYSVNQGSVITDSLLEIMKSNRRDISVGRQTEYVPIAAFKTEKKARVVADKINKELKRKGNRLKNNWHRVSEIIKKIDSLSTWQKIVEPS